MRYTRETLLEWIERCFDEGRLTRWEDSFLISIHAQLEAGRDLSERQEEIVERIYADKTP